MSQSNVKLFEKEEFGKVRVVMQDEDPWFVASDVAKALGYANPQEATREHCRKVNKITQPSESLPSVKCPPTFINIIPESDVYRLVMRSNLPRAVEFQDWICEEVIPSIRKTGGYLATKPDDTPEAILARAVLVAQDTIRRIEAERDEAIRTKAEIGSRREATAMNTASVLSKQNEKLRTEIGDSRTWKQVKALPWFLEVFADTPAAYSVAGRKLSELSRRLGYEIREVEETRYGIVKAYHVDVIEAFRLALKNDLNMMRKYRR